MEQHTIVEAPSTSSVEIKEDAKGTPRVTVKSYSSDVQEAAITALQTYYRTRRVIDSNTADTDKAIMETFELETYEDD